MPPSQNNPEPLAQNPIPQSITQPVIPPTPAPTTTFIPPTPQPTQSAPVMAHTQDHSQTGGVLIGILVGLIIAAVAWAAYAYLGKTDESIQTVNETPSACADYGCLAAAAAQCRTISADVIYKDMPNPLLPMFVMSGTNRFSIQGTPEHCTLSYSSLSSVFTLTPEGQKAALEEGSTQAEIDAQLKSMNESVASGSLVPAICESDAATIAQYLTDRKNGYVGEVSSFTHLDTTTGSVSETTSTLSTGGKLTCKTRMEAEFKPAI